MIQFKITNIKALEGMANQRISGDRTGYLLGTHIQKLCHGGYSTRNGLRLSPLGPQAQVSGAHRNMLAGDAAAPSAFPPCWI